MIAADYLLDLLSQGASVEELLSFGSESMGNPLLICDSRYRILYMSKEDNPDVSLWQKAKLEGYISDTVLADMKQNNVLETLENTTRPVTSDLPNGFHCVRTALRPKGTYCGFIGMYDYHHPFRDEDFRDLLQLGKALSVLVADHPGFAVTEDTEWESLLFELLCCPTGEQAASAVRRSKLSPSSESMKLVCLRPDASAPLPLPRLKDILRPYAGAAVSVLYQDQIVILISETPKDAGRMDALHSFCDAHALRMGISTPFADLTFIPVAFAQARACFHHQSACISFDQVIPEEIRRLCLLQHPQEFFVHPLFRKIQAYDREYHLHYLQTLLTYLRHHGSLRNTAAELNIHYNTMKHRLDVIEEIAGVRLRDDDSLQETLMITSVFIQNPE